MTNLLYNSDFLKFKIETEQCGIKDVLSLSLDGQYVAYAISRGFIYINDLKNEKCIETFDMSKDKGDNYINRDCKFTNDIVWHPFEKHIFGSAHNNNCVYLWNIKTGKKIASLKLNMTFHIFNREISRGINTISWSPNGKLLACGTKDFKIIIWNLLTNKTHIIKGHTGGVSSFVWSLDGTKLISGSYDNTINLWNVSNYIKLDILPPILSSEQLENPLDSLPILPSTLPIMSIKLKPLKNGIKSVLYGIKTPDNKERIKLTLCNTFKEHNSMIYNLSLSPCGKFLACSGFDKIINIWNIITLEHKSRFEYSGVSISSMKWLPDGKTIAICLSELDYKICFLNINTGIKKLEIKFNGLGFIQIDFSLYDWTFIVSTYDQSIYTYNYFGKSNELASTLLLILATKNKKSELTKRLPIELWNWFAFEFLKLF